jgi:hypothetical protein
MAAKVEQGSRAGTEVAGAEPRRTTRAGLATLLSTTSAGQVKPPLMHPALVASARMDEPTGTTHTTGPFRALGARFTITTHDPALTEALATLYAPMATAGATAGDTDAEPTRSDDRPPPVPIVVAPPTPWELWTLAVDGQVTVRSSTPGGILRMLLHAVEDLVRRDPDRPADPATDPDLTAALHLRAASIEVAGTGTLVLTDHRVDLPTLLVRLLHDRDDVRYLGSAAVHLDLDDLMVTSAPTPLTLHRDHWQALPELAELVPAGARPYVDLAWPLPADHLGAIAERTHLEVVCLLGSAADLAPAEPALEPIRPATCVARLLDRLPPADRTALTTERLEQVASLVSRIKPLRVAVSGDPVADAEVVVAAVRGAVAGRPR